MKFGLPLSFGAHFITVFGSIFVWHSGVKELAEVRVIPLEIVMVSKDTNIMPTRQKLPDPKPTETPKQEIKPVIKPEVTSPAKETPIVTDTPSLQEEPPKQAAFSLDALSDMVDQARKESPNKNQQKTLVGEGSIGARQITTVGEGTGLTISSSDYIKTKMKPCWPIDKGVKDYQKLRVEVRLQLSEKGEILDLNVINSAQIIASSNNAWRSARDKVTSALHECAPYAGLRGQDYSEWKSMKLNFQPGET